mmetsp:Transcript_19623/g.28759  ORF Transcript_19623/g.28759 Transcript_19623/m.28759 type:complete len:456 (+) Transcript_19623:132-1499(+)
MVLNNRLNISSISRIFLLVAATPIIAPTFFIGGSSNSASAFTTIPSSPLNMMKMMQSRSSASTIFISTQSRLMMSDNDSNDSESRDEKNEEAEKLRSKAEELREQVRKLEENLGGDRRPSQYSPPPPPAPIKGRTLKNKKILVIGANGRLGSMVCRNLLRSNPNTEVIAAVHTVSENSSTSRGYGRLSYEVGAEDGIGSIGAAWSAEDRTATFEYNAEVMGDYNLRNLRIVEVELLDPLQCSTITEDIDSVIWCATDFNGNAPRAVASLDFAFLFRAVASPTKGRVEIEGLQNILGGLKNGKQSQKWRSKLDGSSSNAGIDPTSAALDGPNDPISFILVSSSPDIFGNFETPYGEFNGLKRQGERMLRNDFPSLSYSILRMGLFDDNFVAEGLDVLMEEETDEVRQTYYDEENIDVRRENSRKRINRRDAASAIGKALTDDDIVGKTVDLWTAVR